MDHSIYRLLQSNDTIDDSSTEIMNPNTCDMFGAFGYLVQGILGILSFMVLVVKRFFEKPRRSWKIWFFDVSKQIVSACLGHLMNLLLAVFFAIGNSTDQCVWYFLNLLIDCTLGVFVLYFLMWIFDGFAEQFNWTSLQSGLYYDFYMKNGKKKTKLKLKMYFAQLLVWLIMTILTKCFLIAVQKICEKFLENIGNFLLEPFTSNGKVKLVMVMIIIPVVLNAIIFWLLDNILKFDPEKGDSDVKSLYEGNQPQVGNNDGNNNKDKDKKDISDCTAVEAQVEKENEDVNVNANANVNDPVNEENQKKEPKIDIESNEAVQKNQSIELQAVKDN